MNDAFPVIWFVAKFDPDILTLFYFHMKNSVWKNLQWCIIFSLQELAPSKTDESDVPTERYAFFGTSFAKMFLNIREVPLT